MLVQGSDKLGPIGHGWTYSAHPICAAAGVANLELVDEMDLVEQCRRDRRLFPHRTALKSRRRSQRIVGEVRGEGMLAAVEFVADRDDRVFFDAVRRRSGAQVAAALARARRHRPRHAARATSSASRRRSA